nr:uncharacterized protein LOC109730690 isoform X2 [Microcebus murinus]
MKQRCRLGGALSTQVSRSFSSSVAAAPSLTVRPSSSRRPECGGARRRRRPCGWQPAFLCAAPPAYPARTGRALLARVSSGYKHISGQSSSGGSPVSSRILSNWAASVFRTREAFYDRLRDPPPSRVRGCGACGLQNSRGAAPGCGRHGGKRRPVAVDSGQAKVSQLDCPECSLASGLSEQCNCPSADRGLLGPGASDRDGPRQCGSGTKGFPRMEKPGKGPGKPSRVGHPTQD